MIVEFYGLPGAGKSMVANLLREALNKNCYQILTADDYLVEYSGKMSTLKSIINFSGIRMLTAEIRIAIKYHLLLNKEVIIRLVRILPVLNFYKAHKNDLIIMDQAIIQQFVSAFFDYVELDEMDFHVFLPLLQKYDVKTIHITVPVETACARIDMRANGNHGRIDSLDNIRYREKILSVQEKNFNTCKRFLESAGNNIDFDNGGESNIDIESLLQFVRI